MGHPTVVTAPFVVTPVLEGVAASEGITTLHHGGESKRPDCRKCMYGPCRTPVADIRWQVRRGIQSSIVSLTRCVITAGSSARSNVTFRSNPCGPVIDTRTPPRRESAAIQAS